MDEANAASVLFFRIRDERKRELAVTLFKDDHVAGTANAAAKIAGDFLHIVEYLLPTFLRFAEALSAGTVKKSDR